MTTASHFELWLSHYAGEIREQLYFCRLGPGKLGHIVADTLLPMMFLGLRKLGNICCEHKMFLNKIRNTCCVQTQNLCPQKMLRARANGETFVSATMYPQQCVLVCQGLKVPYAEAKGGKTGEKGGKESGFPW